MYKRALGKVDATILMFSCVDRAFTLEHPEHDRNKNQQANINYGHKMLKWLFVDTVPNWYGTENQHHDLIKVLAGKLVNGLKHDSFIRSNIILSDWRVGTHDVMFPFRLENNNELPYVIVSPTGLWNVVKMKLDTFYSDAPTDQRIFTQISMEWKIDLESENEVMIGLTDSIARDLENEPHNLNVYVYFEMPGTLRANWDIFSTSVFLISNQAYTEKWSIFSTDLFLIGNHAYHFWEHVYQTLRNHNIPVAAFSDKAITFIPPVTMSNWP